MMKNKMQLFRENLLKQQHEFIESCGGSLDAYIEKYGETKGKEIWAADQKELSRIENLQK